MARYADLIGRRVEVHYRTGSLQLSTIGALVSDTGKAIFVQQHLSAAGKENTMRLEIPYSHVLRVAEIQDEPVRSRTTPKPAKKQ
ncbi:MAG: hypothetical protein WA192_08280 [Candidatus Acidiferrales bacterium]